MLNLKEKQNQKLEYKGLQRYHLCYTWKYQINYALFMVLIVEEHFVVLATCCFQHSTEITKNKTYHGDQT